MQEFAGIVVFAQVVEARSFSAAARSLGMSKSAVSKRVARLEDRLGARLLNRTTRRLSLTEVGAAFYERCARIVSELEDAELAVTRLSSEPRGTLKLNAPVTFGQLQIAPALPELLARHPELRIDMLLSDRLVDLVEEGFDLAIRIGPLPDSTLVARRLAPDRRVVCGTPGYFERHGRPRTPAELEGHNCLGYSFLGAQSEWRFRGPRGERAQRVRGNFQANNGEVLRAALLQGLGLALMPTFIVGRDLAAGRLETVLEEHELPAGGVYAVYPHGRHLSPKVRACVDFLASRFASAPW